MKTDKFVRRWKRRYRQLFERQERLLRLGRIRGHPEQIHDLRVLIRRLRLIVRTSGSWLEPKSARAYCAYSRRVTKATSQLRDHDVSLEWLRAHRNTSALVAHLEAQRQRLWRAHCRCLALPEEAVRLGVIRVRSGKKRHRRLYRRYVQRIKRLEARISNQLPRFFELNLEKRHAFRRSLRLLRYLRELALPKRKHAGDKLRQALTGPQAALGNYQDLIVTEQVLASLPAPQPSRALRQRLLLEKTRQEAKVRASLEALRQAWCGLRS